METALIKVKDDIDQAIDQGYGIALVLLDQSAAFDTIDHSRLLQRLSILGVRGTALQWFRSYLTDRTQAVIIDGVTSEPVHLSTGVPQGSVLGPLLFLFYYTSAANIKEKSRAIVCIITILKIMYYIEVYIVVLHYWGSDNLLY